MKKLFVFIALLLMGLNSICQNQANSKEYYLHKSKNQSTTAWIMMGAGAGLFLGGLALSFSEYYNTGGNAGPVLFWTGTASMLGSIPFFISAHKNKRRAASVSFINEKIWIPQQGSLVGKMRPGLTLRIAL